MSYSCISVQSCRLFLSGKYPRFIVVMFKRGGMMKVYVRVYTGGVVPCPVMGQYCTFNVLLWHSYTGGWLKHYGVTGTLIRTNKGQSFTHSHVHGVGLRPLWTSQPPQDWDQCNTFHYVYEVLECCLSYKPLVCCRCRQKGGVVASVSKARGYV